MLDLNHLRAEFARYLATNTETRWGMDAALMHVCRMAYEAGRADAGASHEPVLIKTNGLGRIEFL